ncbi:MAG: cyanophycinase [Actinomycetia bacterium]|nr:cyanophycinase [Actinomycetes bacterium]
MPDTTGPLLIVGGHEDKAGEAAVLRRLVALAGGTRAVVGVVPTASADESRAVATYVDAFERLGAARVEPLFVRSRWEAVADWDRRAGAVTAVFFTGGDQLRITSTLGGTRFHAWLRARHREGLVIAGTSAGASMMSDVMIVEGDAAHTPTLNTVRLAVGMGFWPGVVIDQHFSQRGRIGRLLSALAQNPAVLGVGIDENTAVEVDFARRTFRVLGQACVTVLDGHGIRATNASESRPGQPLALTDVVLHVLPAPWEYSWANRTPREPEAAPGTKEGEA